jgi:hypothetical protein
MRQLYNLRVSYLLSVLMVFSLFSSQYALASGAQLPAVATTPTDSSGTTTADTTATVAQTTTTPVTTASPAQEPTTISSDYSHLDPGGIVPKERLAKALKYYDDNKAAIRNKDVIGVVDFSQHSSKERFYIIDMRSGRVETYQVAHGKNSDPDYDGFATIFSNDPGSDMSSQGIYVTAETYSGAHGYSLTLDGKSSTNSNARSRAIVIHPADYVVAGQKAGRSWGCFALDPRESVHVIDLIKNGAVIYAE